jgi:hypothetical protein
MKALNFPRWVSALHGSLRLTKSSHSEITEAILLREINLHGHTLFAAKTAVVEHIGNAYNMDENGIVFIHGHNGGTAIRDYIRSSALAKDLAKDGLNVIMRLDSSKPGSTVIHFT